MQGRGEKKENWLTDRLSEAQRFGIVVVFMAIAAFIIFSNLRSLTFSRISSLSSFGRSSSTADSLNEEDLVRQNIILPKDIYEPLSIEVKEVPSPLESVQIFFGSVQDGLKKIAGFLEKQKNLTANQSSSLDKNEKNTAKSKTFYEKSLDYLAEQVKRVRAVFSRSVELKDKQP